MKALAIGLGSIGKRHIGNLEALGIPCASVAVLRRKDSQNPFGDAFLKEHPEHPVFHDLAAALREHQPEIAVITNPNSLHVPSALAAAKAGAHVLVEKPLSHSRDGVDELMREVGGRGLVGMVAYHLRFHPALRQAKAWLDEGRIGKPVSVRGEVAERVTDWHPWEDYRISYAARKDLGGGVLLTQSHELDYLRWLFGEPEWVFASGGTKGELGVDVEDVAEAILGFPRGVDVSLHLDYLKRPAKRELEITGINGRIHADLLQFRATLIPLEKDAQPIIVSPPDGFERNAMYLEELKHFLECVRQGREPAVTLSDGKAAIEIAEALHRSMETRAVVSLA